jgi:hypothetical protein
MPTAAVERQLFVSAAAAIMNGQKDAGAPDSRARQRAVASKTRTELSEMLF